MQSLVFALGLPFHRPVGGTILLFVVLIGAPAICELVAKAYDGMGLALLCESKQLIQKGDVEGSNALLCQALERLDYVIRGNASGMYVGNKAYVLALLGQLEESRRIFAEALSAEVDGGEQLYHGTLTDFDIHPIEQDKAFREIVESQWKIYQTDIVL